MEDYARRIIWDIRDLTESNAESWIERLTSKCKGFIIGSPLTNEMAKENLIRIKRHMGEAYCKLDENLSSPLELELISLVRTGVDAVGVNWETILRFKREDLDLFPPIVALTPRLNLGLRSEFEPNMPMVAAGLAKLNLAGLYTHYATGSIFRSHAPKVLQAVKVRPKWSCPAQMKEHARPLLHPGPAIELGFDYVIVKIDDKWPNWGTTKTEEEISRWMGEPEDQIDDKTMIIQ